MSDSPEADALLRAGRELASIDWVKVADTQTNPVAVELARKAGTLLDGIRQRVNLGEPLLDPTGDEDMDEDSERMFRIIADGCHEIAGNLAALGDFIRETLDGPDWHEDDDDGDTDQGGGGSPGGSGPGGPGVPSGPGSGGAGGGGSTPVPPSLLPPVVNRKPLILGPAGLSESAQARTDTYPMRFYPAGPVPEDAVLRRTAVPFVNVDESGLNMARITLKREGHPEVSATTMHEMFLPIVREPMAEPLRHVRQSIEVFFVDSPQSPWDFGLSGKIGGLVGFNDGDWSHWPGGGSFGNENWSVRNTWWHYNRKPGAARLATYIYQAGVGLDGVEGLDRFPVNYSSNNGHSHEFLLHDYGLPPTNKWISIVNEVDVGRPGMGEGKVTTSVDGKVCLELSGLDLVVDGPGSATHGYLSFMFGGRSEEFAPRTPGHQASLGYRRFRIEEIAG